VSTLREIKHSQLDFSRNDISYFIGRETLVATEKPGMARRWPIQTYVDCLG
jgi:K+ transporter